MADPRLFSRQIALVEIGAAGQERIAASVARVSGEIARRYCERAGFARVEDGGDPQPAPDLVTTEAARDVVAGAMQALRAIRAALDG